MPDEILKQEVERYEQIVKGKYSADQLKALKAKGHTFPGSESYPIDDEEDLGNAIKAVGRGRLASHNEIRKYVMSRAKEMGKTAMIPDGWGSDGSLAKAEFEFGCDSLIKAQAQRIVYGVVLEPDLRDSQGDIVSKEEIEKAAHDYLVESRKSDTQHDGQPNGVQVVESYIAPHDMILHGSLIRKGAWVMGVKVGEDLWKRITDREHPEPLTGFSITGSAVRVPDAEELAVAA